MAIEKVREYFKKMGIENRIMEFEVSSATVKEAAEAIGSESGEIAKSIGFLVDGKPVLIVARGDTKVIWQRSISVIRLVEYVLLQ